MAVLCSTAIPVSIVYVDHTEGIKRKPIQLNYIQESKIERTDFLAHIFKDFAMRIERAYVFNRYILLNMDYPIEY